MASKAAARGTTLRLRPLCRLLGCIIVGARDSLHFRNTLFISFGIPAMTTDEKGTIGRSSIPAARIPNSLANIRALWKASYCDCAREPTMIYISKKASKTKILDGERSACEKGLISTIFRTLVWSSQSKIERGTYLRVGNRVCTEQPSTVLAVISFPSPVISGLWYFRIISKDP